jgi:metallophosphoesterase (TIGR00282 family)
MRVLFFGDVFGRPGRQAVKMAIMKLKPEYTPDFIIVNGENAANGKGITPKIVQEFFDMEVDAITTGNHAWDNAEGIECFTRHPNVLRPANYPDDAPVPGSGAVVITSRHNPSMKLGLVLLMGRVFMDALDCPFSRGKREIKKMLDKNVRSIIVDFHAEASSEKQAFSYYVEGEVSAVVGTHSHVQTADERVLPGGTATITDIGMSGCFDSVIGVKKEIAIKKFVTKMPARFEPAEGVGGYGAVLIDIDDKTGKATAIRRFREETIKWEGL